jgi:hypothetical protein
MPQECLFNVLLLGGWLHPMLVWRRAPITTRHVSGALHRFTKPPHGCDGLRRSFGLCPAMKRIVLPRRFKDRLDGTSLSSPVNGAIDSCCAFYGDPTRGLDLFPEYTDHGVSHVQCVLDSADELLTEAAWDLLTAEDVAVLTIAVLLHDSAMHLSNDGFLALIRGDEPVPLIPGLDSQTWSREWDA